MIAIRKSAGDRSKRRFPCEIWTRAMKQLAICAIASLFEILAPSGSKPEWMLFLPWSSEESSVCLLLFIPIMH
jgi:hypothetical protein